MNKKQIQIAIMIVCFTSAGFVLYRGFGGSSSSVQTPALNGPDLPGMPGAPGSASSTPTGTENILPFGEHLNIDDVFSPHNFQFGAYTYPVLNTTTDVGLPLQDLFKPDVSSTKSRNNP